MFWKNNRLDNLSSHHDLDLLTNLNESFKWHSYSWRRTLVSNVLKSIQFVGVMVRTKITGTNVSNGISTHDWEQLCQIILKSIYNCRSTWSGKIQTQTHRDARAYTELWQLHACPAHWKWAWQKWVSWRGENSWTMGSWHLKITCCTIPVLWPTFAQFSNQKQQNNRRNFATKNYFNTFD